jgi:Phage integrase, N-terminal SAM-like domain
MIGLPHLGEVLRATLKTQSDYIRVVKNFTIFLGRSPDTASNEDLRRFQLHLSEKRVGAPTINLTISALRFFFTVTLDRTDAVKHLWRTDPGPRTLGRPGPTSRPSAGGSRDDADPEGAPIAGSLAR